VVRDKFHKLPVRAVIIDDQHSGRSRGHRSLSLLNSQPWWGRLQ
jgi:hypothetical protein